MAAEVCVLVLYKCLCRPRYRRCRCRHQGTLPSPSGERLTCTTFHRCHLLARQGSHQLPPTRSLFSLPPPSPSRPLVPRLISISKTLQSRHISLSDPPVILASCRPASSRPARELDSLLACLSTPRRFSSSSLAQEYTPTILLFAASPPLHVRHPPASHRAQRLNHHREMQLSAGTSV